METQIGQDLDLARQYLERHELVAIPTETVYGLAANALSAEAVAKIYQVKNRPQFNPLILHVSHLEDIEKYTLAIPHKIRTLLEHFSPGPLTVLLPKSKLVNELVTAGSLKVALRIPNHKLTLALLKLLSFPLAAPSANISGYVSPTSALHVLDQFNGKIPYILQGNTSEVGIESTIIGYEALEERVVVHRIGGLSLDAIENYLGENIIMDIHHNKPETPGQLKSHYATHTPLLLGCIEDLILDKNLEEIVLINYHHLKNYPVKKQFVLTPSNTSSEAAQNLFSAMRDADKCGAKYILCEWAPEEGLGLAINDRLSKASFKF